MALPTYGALLRAYMKKHKHLVEPRQGFDSLCDELHLAYSMGRKRGFTDLGTYVNKPLDHGGLPWARHEPAWAFDLGREDKGFWQRQYGQLMTWRYVRLLRKHNKALKVEYVIYRDKIWSRRADREDRRILRKPFWWGFRYYGPDKSHFYHVHVSGHWFGRGET